MDSGLGLGSQLDLDADVDSLNLADTLPDVQYFRLPRAVTNASMYYVPSRGGFAVVQSF